MEERDSYNYSRQLNTMVNDAKKKDRKEWTKEEKLAEMILFNLNYFRQYNLKPQMTYMMYVLDNYTHFEVDEKDILRRRVLVIDKIPAKVAKCIKEDYKAVKEATKIILERLTDADVQPEMGEYSINEDGCASAVSGEYTEDGEEEYYDDEEDYV